MSAPSWLSPALAALMMLIAVGCTARLGLARRRGRRADVESDGLHAAMAVAMAGMLLPAVRVLPWSAWEVAFGGAAAWFAWQALGARRLALPSAAGGHRAPLPHLVECVAMFFMFLPLAGRTPAGALGLSQVVALLLALCMVGCAVWATDKMVRAKATPADAALTVRLADGGRIAMSLAMLYMLIQMA